MCVFYRLAKVFSGLLEPEESFVQLRLSQAESPQQLSTGIADEMFHLVIPAKISLLHSSNLAAVSQ